MEVMLPILTWLLGAPILAGTFAGRARYGWLGVAALVAVVGPAFILTAMYGWPFDTCYTNGGCWEGLVLIPVYASAAFTILVFSLAALLRRRAPVAAGSASADFNQGTH